LLSVEMERLFQEARGRARGELADQLNQAVRRIRQASTPEELLATLLDAACGFAGGAAVFRIEGEVARGQRIRGVPEKVAQVFGDFEIPLASAAALAGAVESRDPVIAATTGPEVSGEMAGLAEHGAEDRASIFPLVVENRVPALLYAWGDVQGAALELFAQVAAAAWSEPAAAPVELVTIAAPAADPVPAPAAPELSGEQERMHLKAQRFARVQVAEMRLNEAAAVHSGAAQRNLYESLRPRVDAARAAMREKFFEPCPGMLDYLHLELVRTLAHDDPELLGKDYPGPLA
ncbi:MAG: hypothetical protein ABSH40_06435, partial [Bryobacteraceae bacterium]